METTLKNSILNNNTGAHIKDSRSGCLFLDFRVNEYSKAEISLQAILYSSPELL